MSDKLSIPVEGSTLDLATRDVGLVREAIRRRWPVSDDMKRRVVEAIDRGLIIANESTTVDDLARIKAFCDLARVTVMMEGQVQTDEHEQTKQDRAEKGLPNDSVSIIDVAFPKVRKTVKNTAEE